MRHILARLYLLQGQLLIRLYCLPGVSLGGHSAAAESLPGHFPDGLHSICWPTQARTTD